MGEKEEQEDDSINTPVDKSEEESMFGSDVNKKTGRPVRGYRWMCFTWVMIIVLSVVVFFKSDMKSIVK